MDPFTIEVFTLWGVSAVVIGIRTYARWSTVGIREFQVDDYLMIVACVGLPHLNFLWFTNSSYWLMNEYESLDGIRA